MSLLFMPFSLCNVPSTFQRLMEKVLPGLARNICTIYFEEYLCNLKCVFNCLQIAGHCLNPSKCYLVRKEVEYLGYVIFDLGMAADPKKIKAVKEFPVPGNLEQLRSFLGLASYFRGFIKKVANPLFALTTKDVAYEWTDQCQL